MRIRVLRALLAMLAAVAITAAAGGPASIEIVAIDGRPLNLFEPAGTANVIFFVATDCPISNSYAPEIQRVCREYGPRGVGCSLIYEDVDTARRPRASTTRCADISRNTATPVSRPPSTARARSRHARSATITPQAVVIDRAGAIRYRGRIDNFYAALGKPRQQVTEHDLRDALDAVLSGRPVPKIETEALGCYIVDPAVLRK